MLKRRSALTKVARKGWHGSYADSLTHAEIFRSYRPTDFGMLDARMFSSEIESNIINKPWMWLTAAQGHMMSTEPGHVDYQWKLAEDVIADLHITRVDANLGTQPGKGHTEFVVYADNGNFHEPVLLKTDSSNAPLLRMLGKAERVAAAEWRYRFKLQTSDPTAFIDPKWLQPNRRLVDAGTSTADELNVKYAGDSYGNVFQLQSRIGYVGRKVEVTDKFIRLEMEGKGNASYKISGSKGVYNDGAIGVGYTYQPGLSDKTKSKVVPQGSFITMAEARLGERLNEDKNNLMEWGQAEVTVDPQTGRQIGVGAGWRQIRKDGNFRPHNGSLSLYDLYENVQDLYTTRTGVGEPKIILRTGKGGIELFSRAISAEAGTSPFTVLDSYFIQRTNSDITPNALKYGAQFTEILMTNGLTLTVMYDATKDNPRMHPEKVPGTNYSYESFTYDCFDLGNSDAAPSGARTRSNIAYIYEEAYEEYFSVSNVYDIYSGAKKSGENVAVLDKQAGIYRGSSCGLAVWDTSRILCMPYQA